MFEPICTFKGTINAQNVGRLKSEEGELYVNLSVDTVLELGRTELMGRIEWKEKVSAQRHKYDYLSLMFLDVVVRMA